MRRLVSVRIFYTLGGEHIAYGITQMLSGFPYGRAQHVRGVPSNIVTVVYVSMWFFICHVMSGSATCPFLAQK